MCVAFPLCHSHCPPTPPHLPPTTDLDQRDAEHRESLSNTLRTLRADSLRQSDNISRLQDRYSEAQRKVNIADAEEAALRAQLKAAEATIHKLRDDAARTKKIVAETRAACANDVRKRDRQIEGLKKAVVEAGRARGERKSPAVTTIHVTGGIGGDDNVIASTTTTDDGYDLRQETNGFLAQLAKGLSEENETLLSLIRTTNDSLKSMSGWEKSDDAVAVGAGASGDGHAVTLPANPEELATDVENVLAHLRTLLTNPSFVPLEEVVVREQEIFRLRDGWEKMESRWQEAVHLIDSWRRRMAADGQPVNMEELKLGLRLSPVRVPNVYDTAPNEAFNLSTLQEEEEEDEEKAEEEEGEDGEEQVKRVSLAQQQASPSPPDSLHLVPAPEYGDMAPEYEGEQDDLDDIDTESSIFQDDVDVDMDESEPNVEILHHSTAYAANGEEREDDKNSASISLPAPPKITPLEETQLGSNRVPAAALTLKSRKRSGNLLDDSTDGAEEAPPPPPHGIKSGQSPQKRLKVSSDAENEQPSSRPTSGIFDSSNSSLDKILLGPSPSSITREPASSRTTARSTRSNTSRSDVAAKKEQSAYASAKPVVRTVKTAAQEKKDTPTRPLTRTRSARTTGATASSSVRAAPPSKSEPPKTRPAPAPTTTTTAAAITDMRPPPRPARNRQVSPAVQPTSTSTSVGSSQADKKSTPGEHQDQPTAAFEAPPSISRTTKAPVNHPPSAPDTPVRTSVLNPPTNTNANTKSASRLPLPRNGAPPPQQSPITVAGIAAKLAASEREANAARVRAKLKAARLGGGGARGGASASTSTGSSVRVVSGESALSSSSAAGDPSKRDREVSGASSVAISSLDENGTAGGVSIMPSKESSAGASSTFAPHTATSTTTTSSSATEDNNPNNKTVVPASGPIIVPPRSSSVQRKVGGRVDVGDGQRSSSPKRRGRAVGAEVHSAAAVGVASAAASPLKSQDQERDRDQDQSQRKKKRDVRSRADKVASRRRSTLSPWELQSLIAGDVGAVPSTPEA